MTLIRTGGGVTDIRGGFGGVCFTRDRSGLHCSAKPRKIYRRSAAQNLQRNAFIKARAACLKVSPIGKPRDWLNRWVSYYVYRALNGLPFIFDAIVTGDMAPDCTGKYLLAGTHNDKDYYERSDSAYLIWWDGSTHWYISDTLDVIVGGAWERTAPNIEGNYIDIFGPVGIATVTLSLTPPPIDYQIPKL